MNAAEKDIAYTLLCMLAHQLSRMPCNDFEFPATPENLLFAAKFFDEPQIVGSDIYVANFVVLRTLARILTE